MKLLATLGYLLLIILGVIIGNAIFFMFGAKFVGTNALTKE